MSEAECLLRKLLSQAFHKNFDDKLEWSYIEGTTITDLFGDELAGKLDKYYSEDFNEEEE